MKRIEKINIVFLITIMLSVLISFLPISFPRELVWLQLIFSQLIILLPSAVYMVKEKIPYKEAVRLKKMKVGDIALSILFGILIQPFMTLINAVSMVFARNTTSTFLVEMSGQVPFLAAILLVAVMPAILEETVYRGVFFNEYRKVNPWLGALISGLLFGIMHGNLNQFCYATVMGILFAMLIEATDSILSTMLVHFWTNAGSTVMIYVYPKLYEVAQKFYEMYKENGNEELAEQLELSFGDMTLSGTEWMNQMFDAADTLPMSIGAVLALYAPMALIAGVLAFFVYRALAGRNGNWERICGYFTGKKQDAAIEAGVETVKKEKLFTRPLKVAIIIGVWFMFYYESLL